MAKWIEKGKNEGEMIMTLSGPKWTNARIAAMNVLKKAGKELSEDNITEAALNSRLDNLFAEGLEELGLSPATIPDVEVRSASGESVTVAFLFALAPDVALGDYSNIRYQVIETPITEEDIEEGIRSWMKQKSSAGKESDELPELTDEYVKTQRINNVKTADQFRSYIRDLLAVSRKKFDEQEAERRMINDLLEITEVEIPYRMIMAELSGMLQTLVASLAGQQIGIKDYIEARGITEDELIAELRPGAEEKVRASLALEAVGKEQKLYPSNSEIEGEYRALAMRHNISVEEVKQSLPASELSYQLMMEKTVDYLKRNGNNESK